MRELQQRLKGSTGEVDGLALWRSSRGCWLHTKDFLFPLRTETETWSIGWGAWYKITPLFSFQQETSCYEILSRINTGCSWHGNLEDHTGVAEGANIAIGRFCPLSCRNTNWGYRLITMGELHNKSWRKAVSSMFYQLSIWEKGNSRTHLLASRSEGTPYTMIFIRRTSDDERHRWRCIRNMGDHPPISPNHSTIIAMSWISYTWEYQKEVLKIARNSR